MAFKINYTFFEGLSLTKLTHPRQLSSDSCRGLCRARATERLARRKLVSFEWWNEMVSLLVSGLNECYSSGNDE